MYHLKGVLNIIQCTKCSLEYVICWPSFCFIGIQYSYYCYFSHLFSTLALNQLLLFLFRTPKSDSQFRVQLQSYFSAEWGNFFPEISFDLIFVKEAKSQKVFSLWLKIPKSGPNHYSKHLLFW